MGHPIEANIYINDELNTKANLFKSNLSFDGSKQADYYILYLRKTEISTFPVITVDKKSNLVCFPNASINDYDLFLGKLFQIKAGAKMSKCL